MSRRESYKSTLLPNMQSYKDHKLQFIDGPLRKSDPKIVLSVVGDSDSFVPKPWLRSKFQDALIAAAKNAGDSWVFCGKQGQRVSDMVHDAVQEYERMEFFKYNGRQIKPEKKIMKILAPKIELHVFSFTSVSEDEPTQYETGNKHEERTIHFHEIFVKGEDPKEYIRFMVDLEKYISTKYSSYFTQFAMHIPVLIIVVEGDISTIEHVYEAVKVCLPIIVVKGTGKASDLIVECMETSDSDNMLEIIKLRVPVLFGAICETGTTYTCLKEQLCDIRTSYRSLINIYDIENEDPIKLSEIAGEAVVRSWINRFDESSPSKEQRTMLETIQMTGSSGVASEESEQVTDQDQETWPKTSKTNKHGSWKSVTSKFAHKSLRRIVKVIFPKPNCQVSRCYELSSDFKTPTSLPLHFYFAYQIIQQEDIFDKIITKKELLLEALRANRTDYVQVLLDHDMQDMQFGEEEFIKLYQLTVKCEDCDMSYSTKCLHIQWILKQVDEEDANSLFLGERSSRNSARFLCVKLLGFVRPELTKDNVIEDLFLWSLYANRPKIASILWEKTENQLFAGIVAAVLLEKLAKRASEVKEHQACQSLIDHSKFFKDISLLMMDKMYKFDPETAMLVFDTSVLFLGINSSPMEFCYENNLYDHIAHDSCQKILNRIWYNKMTPHVYPFLKSVCYGCVLKSWVAPATKFIVNYLIFFAMLIIYSAYVMTSIGDDNYTRVEARCFEYITYIWAFGDMCEEGYTIYKKANRSLNPNQGIVMQRSRKDMLRRIWRHFTDFRNIVDLLSYLLLLVAVFVRHLHSSEDHTHARRLYSLSLLFMYLRFLQIFFLDRTLGPKLAMTRQMTKDLLYFLLIAVVLIIGVGVYYHANLFPDHLALFGPGDFSDWDVWKVFYYPYFQLYGELFNDFLEGKDTSDCVSNMTLWYMDQTQERCPQRDWTVSVMSAIYMLISNLMLVNLVIAMFSYTFNEVQQDSEKVWRFERYATIYEYNHRIPSPLNLLIRPIAFLYRKCKRNCGLNPEDSRGEQEKRKKRERDHLKEIQKIFAVRCFIKKQ